MVHERDETTNSLPVEYYDVYLFSRQVSVLLKYSNKLARHNWMSHPGRPGLCVLLVR